jgi:hypothetical protein
LPRKGLQHSARRFVSVRRRFYGPNCTSSSAVVSKASRLTLFRKRKKKEKKESKKEANRPGLAKEAPKKGGGLSLAPWLLGSLAPWLLGSFGSLAPWLLDSLAPSYQVEP